MKFFLQQDFHLRTDYDPFYAKVCLLKNIELDLIPNSSCKFGCSKQLSNVEYIDLNCKTENGYKIKLNCIVFDMGIVKPYRAFIIKKFWELITCYKNEEWYEY